MPPIRVLLVDDSREFIDAVMRFLSVDKHYKVIGHTLSGREAIDQIGQLKPDVVLLDLAMPDINGLEITRQDKTMPEAPYVILVTLYDNNEYRTAAKAAQADGYITKSDLGTQLLPLINSLIVHQQISL
jgi:DNA-binding NarL/FixJ family response regulator